MRVSALFFLLALIFPDASGCERSPNQIDVDRIINVAEYQAMQVLDSGRCKAAFQAHMPGYDDEWLLRGTFEDQVKYHRVPGFIPKNPFAWAVVDCDKSQNTFIIADGFAGWVGVEKMKETFIHEYVHLLRCEAIIHDCGSQSNCQPSRQVLEERLAYMIAALCLGK